MVKKKGQSFRCESACEKTTAINHARAQRLLTETKQDQIAFEWFLRAYTLLDKRLRL